MFWVLANHDKPEIQTTLGRIQGPGSCEILDDIIFIPPKNIKSAVCSLNLLCKSSVLLLGFYFKHVFSRFGINVFRLTSGAFLKGNLKIRVRELAYFISRM